MTGDAEGAADEQRPTSDDEGSLIAGKYVLGRRIGEGSMAIVFEAENQWTKGKVAIKWLRVRAETDPTTAHRFIREARTAARLAHPNIVMTVDMGQHDDGSLYVVQERLHGQDLERTLEDRGKLGARQAIRIIHPIMRALAYAHERDVVHRDVKPANIFLCSIAGHEMVPKLLDFGMAKVLRDETSVPLTQSGAILGTPYYMAPEQIRGGSGIDARADQWAVAVTLYRALTGEVPFAGRTFIELARSVVDGTPARLPEGVEVFEQLQPILDRALQKDPQDRFPDMRSFADEVAGVISEGQARSSSTSLRETGEGEETVVDERPPQFVVLGDVERDEEIGGMLRVGLAGLSEGADTAGITRAFERAMRVPCELSRAVDYRDLVRALREGEVELAWLPPVAYLEAIRQEVAVPLVRPFRHGSSYYASALLGNVKRVRHIEDAIGSTAAWVDPWSAAGHLVPRSLLRAAEIDPVEDLEESRFLGAYAAVLEALRQGAVGVGASHCSLDDTGDILNAPWPSDGTVKCLRVSDPIPPDVMCARASMEPERISAVATALKDGPRAYDVLQLVRANGFIEPNTEVYDRFRDSIAPELETLEELNESA